MANYRRLVHAGSPPPKPPADEDKQFYPAPKGHTETAEGMRDSSRSDMPPPNPAPVSDIDARTRGQ